MLKRILSSDILTTMKSKTRKDPFRVGAFFNRKTKASREQVGGIFRFAGAHADWELHLFTRPDTPEDLNRIVRSFVPDGIITGHPNVLTLFRRRLHRAIPGVLVDFASSEKTKADARVFCDDHAIGAFAAKEFLHHGFTSFAFAGIEGGTNDSDAFNAIARENGFVRALAKAGFRCATYRERTPPNVWHYSDTARLTSWLDSLTKPCALLTHSDLLAQSVLNACKKAGYAVPEQIAIVGIDNEESVCENSTPTLSSIEPDFAGGGFRAAEILDTLMRHGKGARVSHRATYGVLRFVDRMSSQNVTGAHRRTARALEVIRAKALSGIGTADVAIATGVSPRMLEFTFRKTLGHTVRDEILRVRLNEAKRLLETTHIHIGDIAAHCGFRTPSALKAIFARRFGMSMREWRRSAR